MKKLTMQDLQQNYTQTPSGIWVVDNTLRTNRKRISLLCGSPHAGKSTLARQLAVAVVHGELFLGRATFKSKVVYWQSEETEEDAREDFHKSGMSFDDTDFCLLHAEGAENNLTALNECLNDDPDIRLVIIETLDDFLQVDDLNKNNEVRKVFEKFYDEVIKAHTHRCVFVALHHFKKSDEQHGTSMTRILGATVIAGHTDAKMFMRGCGDNDPRRVISIQTRKGIPIEPTYLTFDVATQTSMLGTTVAEDRTEKKRAVVSMNAAELRQKCIAVVAENPLISKTKACELVGGHRDAAFGMFDTLITEGAIQPQRGGKTGTAILLSIEGVKADNQRTAACPQCHDAFDSLWHKTECAQQGGMSCTN
jgi:energy-coupling factor transporter ATP-binding protein EcfA2